MKATQYGAFPDFLVIGAQKSATRWLRTNLNRHPEIFMAGEEPSFFDRRFDRGAVAYWKLFAGRGDARLVGEATPGYMMWNSRPQLIAARVDGMLPGVKLIAILRNPIDRAYSAFRHHQVKGRIPPGIGFLEALGRIEPRDDPLCLVGGGWYAASLEPYVHRFGPRLAVFVTETTATTGAVPLYESALLHVGAKLGFVPEGLGEVVFSSRVDEDDAPTAEERSAVAPLFEEEVRLLQEMIDIDLTLWGDFSG